MSVLQAITVPVGHGDAYYMLGNFNHHHQHAVLAGDQCWRFSSTHRQVTSSLTAALPYGEPLTCSCKLNSVVGCNPCGEPLLQL